jgi:hypothetical protein
MMHDLFGVASVPAPFVQPHPDQQGILVVSPVVV